MLLHNRSGEKYHVDFLKLTPEDVKSLMQGWDRTFNWNVYFKSRSIEVYKMCIPGQVDIQGAIALEDRGDHVFVHLIESAPQNRYDKTFEYVGEHLIAYACLRSVQLGYDGFIALDTKTRIGSYYETTFGARRLGNSNRMILNDVAGHTLINVYLKQR
ncbi:hypothetical protein DFQ01_110104 [Paenibacillus cellulosilyticus]|uniref:Acetyltransferase (GNAT) family protein n=1 Tax=Paenibacillus cellulosilyticus TaxID=375489 RepID=A0A2V2YWA2_9BACL|nr:hypothetical protein [Paenibacillus cellulosilyticus]PWW01214.1 hypothetical protein DFQ01_110104 [Paenibacillus cellulosilyticus]QKS46831.1 hypothetical protein HUB94_20320 [Paenibacillus cellulosilyticus]